MAGEEKSTRSPICPCHARESDVALPGLMVCSKALTLVRAGECLNEGQLVWTVNVVEAVRPLACPVACTAWDPGCADFDTVRAIVKLPEPSGVAVASVAESKVMATVSPAENPEPVAVVLVVGGPSFGESETDAAAAKLAPDKKTTNRSAVT